MNKRIISITIMIALTWCGVASARIKMVALPQREEANIRLDNPRSTLIEEERTLTLQKGVNKVDFSWNGVSIDPDSIRLEILSHPKEVTLLNVSYPPNENALVWEISSADAFEEKVRVSYLLSYIDRLITYKAVVDKQETQIDLNGHLILRNFSGEDFAKANILLDKGDKIEKGIQHEETTQLLFLKAGIIPIKKVWKWDSQLQTWDPEKVNDNVGIPVNYKITNSKQNNLGNSALWGGKARIYQVDGHGSTILLGEDIAKLTPVGEDVELYIGDSRDIVVTQRKMDDKQINIKRNISNSIVLYDLEEKVTAKIENFKDSKAILTLVEHIPGEWDMKNSNLKYTKKDANTIEYEIELAPQAKQELTMHYVLKNLR